MKKGKAIENKPNEEESAKQLASEQSKIKEKDT